MKKIWMVATAAVAIGVAAGCSTLGKQAFAEPVVSLRDVRVTGIGLTGGSLDVILSVYNPNGYRLDATRLTYNLYVDSTKLGNGELDRTFTVQDKDSTRVNIPVTFNWNGLGAGVRSIFNTGSVNYRVAGEVTVGTPVGNFTKAYSQTGRYNTIR